MSARRLIPSDFAVSVRLKPFRQEAVPGQVSSERHPGFHVLLHEIRVPIQPLDATREILLVDHRPLNQIGARSKDA